MKLRLLIPFCYYNKALSQFFFKSWGILSNQIDSDDEYNSTWAIKSNYIWTKASTISKQRNNIEQGIILIVNILIRVC